MLDNLSHKDLPSCLNAIAGCLTEAFPEGHPGSRALNVLHDRLHEARLQVAILGQFKRGKSTFINALLRAPMLPSAVVPATAIPTFIAWEAAPRIHVTYQDNRPPEDCYPADTTAVREQLREWVTEEGNSANRRRVQRVELFVPAEVLHNGMVLIDTPGIGSTLQHNTDAALQVLPECDAALFVLSADPPITKAEVAYLHTIRPHVVRLFFVLNKIDYLDPQEQPAAVDFLNNTLCRALEPHTDLKIFPISARRALEAALHKDDTALETSGLPQLERDIIRPLANGKLAALRASVVRKAKMLLTGALGDLTLKIRALELPLEDLEQRARALGEAVGAIDKERQVAHDTLQGDRQRAVLKLECQADELRQEAQRFLDNLVQRRIMDDGGNIDRSTIQQSLDMALPAFFEARLTKVAAEFRHLVEETLARHQAKADVLIGLVRTTTASLFDIALPPQEAVEPFRLGPEPYWVTQKLVHALIPSPAGVLRWMLPGAMRQRYLRHSLDEEIANIVQRNVENLRWTTLRGLDDTFRRLAMQIDERLQEAIAATDSCIRQVIERRRQKVGNAADELKQLRELEHKLRRLASDLADPDTPRM